SDEEREEAKQLLKQIFQTTTAQLNQRDLDMARGNRGLDELKSWSIMGKMFVYRTFFPHD
ncbi:MAG: hypothetical protein ACOVO7_04040, partial [Microcystis aeruginosa]